MDTRHEGTAHIRLDSVECDNEFTVDEAIAYIGKGRFQTRILIVTGLLYAADAIEIMILTFLLPILQDEWDLTTAQIGTIGSVIFAGMFCGTVFWSTISDKFGRKPTVISSNIGQIAFGLLSAASNGMYSMMAFRFLTGFFLGGSSSCFTMYAELAPKSNRGKLLVIQQSFWSIGTLVNVVIAWLSLSYLNWRWYLIISSIPTILILIGTLKLPESVPYLVAVGEMERAQQILNDAYTENHGKSADPKITLKAEREVVSVRNRGNICDVFGKRYFRESVLLFITYFFTMFCSYGLSFISERFFSRITTDDDDKYLMMVITTFAKLPGILIVMYSLDSFGRKRSMYCSFSVFALTMLILVFEAVQNITILSVSLIFVNRICDVVSAFGLYVYFVEFYPTEIRTISLGFANALSSFGGMATMYISQDDNITYSFFLYVVGSCICAVCSALLRSDTKGNDLTAESLHRMTKTDDNEKNNGDAFLPRNSCSRTKTNDSMIKLKLMTSI